MPQPDDIQIALIHALQNAAVVSGSDLAQRLGISRAAIWKRVVSLRDAGFAIEGNAGSGYQLLIPYRPLDAEIISSAMPEHARKCIADIAVAWQVDSTNSVLMRRGSDDILSASALMAEIQTAGRGRRGRAWRSTPGGSLTLSLRWGFERGMSAMAGLSVVVGLCVIEALHDIGIGDLGLKWPNDVVANGRKLAGILVELGGEAHGPCYAVIGIGINVHIDPLTAVDIDQAWIDLYSLQPQAHLPDRNPLAAALLSRLVESMQRFAADGFAAFADKQARYDALLGQHVVVEAPAGNRNGIANGVDARGALQVRDDDGEFLVETGEVSVRLGCSESATPARTCSEHPSA